MKILIHAYPKRMWYVDEFIVPELIRQGMDPADIEIWNDTEKRGNLRACMDSFAARTGDGGTWHIQDDCLLCRDFVQRCREHDEGVVYGFANEQFTDDVSQVGRVPVESAWHSFQCVRIPDAYARDCADWLWNGDGKNDPYYPFWIRSGKMDDSVFRSYLIAEHPYDYVFNLAPNLTEHVDWIIGGSILFPYRGYICRAHYWDDEELVEELKEAVKGKVRYVY